MRELPLNLTAIEKPLILCLGAHCDDIEIGCGGTLLRISEAYPAAEFRWVVFSSPGDRAAETKRAADSLLQGSRVQLQLFEFRDGFLPFEGADVKDALRSIASCTDPDLVFTHYRNDAHQDHRLVSEITANLFRDHLTLEYEIPKFDGDLGQPNVYVPLGESHVDAKVDVLMNSFPSQAGKGWFTDETFRSLMRLRGIEAGRDCRYAEGFYGRKLRLSCE